MSSDDKSSRIENVHNQLLSDNWYVLRKYTYDLIKRNVNASRSPARYTTGETARRSCFITALKKPFC